MLPQSPDPCLSLAEAVAVSVVSFLAWIVVCGYAADRLGMPMAPAAIVPLSIGATAAACVRMRRRVEWGARDAVALVVASGAVLAWLLWLAWPALLPPGRGPDLAHHLLLIDYIERHWRLVHEASVEIYLGQMVHYTPGFHIVAAIAGAWTRTDGLRVVYPLIACAVALKIGFVFLIALRVLPRDLARMPFALAAVLLLLLPRAYLVGSFTHDSFFAQVVSETFAVAMWWAVVVWDERRPVERNSRPWPGAMAVFALAGAAAFLTWPVWVGPPVLMLVAVVLAREGLPTSRRVAHLALAVGPIAAVAVVYAAGRVAHVGLVSISAGVPRPAASDFGWLFLATSALGLVIAARHRFARATALLLVALALQAATLYALAKRSGADTPYMALKMIYLAIYPLAVVAALALAAAWQAVIRTGGERSWSARLRGATGERVAWALLVIFGVAVARQVTVVRRPKPVITRRLSLAGQWARTHVEPTCVDYLVADSDAAYWLHLAVLGNRWMSTRTADPATFDPHAALVRWIEPRSLPFAIADVGVAPKLVLSDAEVLADFGQAVVIRRRGESVCPD